MIRWLRRLWVRWTLRLDTATPTSPWSRLWADMVGRRERDKLDLIYKGAYRERPQGRG